MESLKISLNVVKIGTRMKRTCLPGGRLAMPNADYDGFL